MNNGFGSGHSVSSDRLIKAIRPLLKIADGIGGAQIAWLSPPPGDQVICGQEGALDIVDEYATVIQCLEIGVPFPTCGYICPVTGIRQKSW